MKTPKKFNIAHGVARRIQSLPPYLFDDIHRTKERAVKAGVEVIDLGCGDPDMPTPDRIVHRLCQAARDPANHRYPSYRGMASFRQAVASWYKRRFNVELDSEAEVLILIGSKEGIGHLCWAWLDPGDLALVPDPAYPVYENGSRLAGADVHKLPLRGENDFLPDMGDIDGDIARRAKILFLNYPNNPTGSVADRAFFQEVVDFARRHQIVVCHDAAYTEICYDGFRAPSLLSAKGAREIGIEFHSLSKTFNMCGWRVGFAVGNRHLIAALGKIKTNLDSGVFTAIQYAGIEALAGHQEELRDLVGIYQRRRDRMVDGLSRAGWEVQRPKGGLYIWAPTIGGQSCLELTKKLIEEAGVVVTPGVGLGQHGEGYVRMSLTIADDEIEKGLERFEKFLNSGGKRR